MSKDDFPNIIIGHNVNHEHQEKTDDIFKSGASEEVILNETSNNESFFSPNNSGQGIKNNNYVTPNPTDNDTYTKEEIERIVNENIVMNKELIKLRQLNKNYLVQIDTYEKSLNNNKKIIEGITVDRDKLQKEYDVMIERLNKTKEAFDELKLIALQNKKEAEKANTELGESIKLSEKYSKIEKQINKKEEEINKLQSLTEEQQFKIKEMNLYLEKAQSLNDEYEGKTSELVEQVEQLEKQLKEMKISKDSVDENNLKLINEMQQELSEARMRLVEKSLELENKEAYKTLSTERMKEIEESIKKNKERYLKAEEHLLKREEQFNIKEEELNSKINSLQQDKESLEEEKIQIELKYEEEKAITVELQGDLNLLRETYNDTSTKLQLANKKLDELETELNKIKSDFEATSNQLIDSQNENLEVNKQMEELITKLENYQNDNNTLVAENVKLKDDLENIRNKFNVLSSIPILKDKNVRISSTVDEIQHSIEEVASTTDSLTENLKEDLSEALEKISKYEELLKEKDLELSNLKKVKYNETNLVETTNNDSERFKTDLDITVKKLKNSEETIIRLNEDNRRLKNDLITVKKQSKDNTFVDEIIKRNFGMTLSELHNKFNEFSVTLEIAEFNLQVMKDYPDVRKKVDDKIKENQDKLYKLITRPFKG